MVGLQQYLHDIWYSDVCSCPLPAMLKDCSIWIHCLTEELKKRREAGEGAGITFASIHLENGDSRFGDRMSRFPSLIWLNQLSR